MMRPLADCARAARNVPASIMTLLWKIMSVALFLGLILGGVIIKRQYGHPELVPAFHIPAAVVLVWVVSLNRNERKEARYRAELEALRLRGRPGAALQRTAD